jgi:threonine aldolase
MIDLRSDTVTRPCAAMRAAMASAEVGDDVMGDDPTVQRLQASIAERAGKEAALFFPTGTQSNLAALMSHCDRGDEYLVGQLAHTYKFEGGGAAVLGSIQPQPIEHAEDGSLPLDKLEAAIKPAGDVHFPRTRLLALENTCHGKVIPQPYITDAIALARRRGLNTHLDGARVFNAAIANGVPLERMCLGFDSVSICLSKGLGAPVGSLLVGDRDLIKVATRWRKVVGGGMRQSGILAAAALYALDHNVDRLAEDHANAERLARGLRSIDQVEVVGQATNMVFVRMQDSDMLPLQEFARARGVLLAPVYGGAMRLVTHLDVNSADIDTVVATVKGYFTR